MNISVIFKTLKMLYNIFWYSMYSIKFIFHIFWFISTLASAVIPWFTLFLVIICILSKFIKLKNPNEKCLINLLGGTDDISFGQFWAIVNQGGAYDAPENTNAALKRCSALSFRNVFLDVGLTACGELVILHKSTLEKAGLNSNINKYTLNELNKINVSDFHPLGSKFRPESIITLGNLITYLDSSNLTIFLYISETTSCIIEKLKNIINKNENFTSRFIIVSRSPLAVYQLRKLYPNLICGLWIEKSLSQYLFEKSSLITSIYGAIVRNIISPVIGISVVFLSKDEFNLQISELWRNAGVRPIVFKVNSPNEKRYFQVAMKTQYLTDSLRSEPQLIIK